LKARLQHLIRAMSTDVPSSRLPVCSLTDFVKFDRELKIVPDLSTDWENEDSRTYISSI